MKQKDITLVLVVGIASAIFALVISNIVFSSPKKRTQQAEIVDVISPEFKVPDKTYFNNDSIDPTQIIRIGDNTNQSPFNQPKQ